MSKLFFPLKVYGLDNLPKKGAYILASNHQSNVDPSILGYIIPRPISYFAKESLFKHPFLKWSLTGLGAFPVKRGYADIRAIRESLRRLKRGLPLLLFPQGTRGEVDLSEEIPAGIGLITQKSGVPVVPVYIKDSDKTLPRGSKFFKYHPVKVFLGTARIYPAQYSPQETARQIMHDIKSLAQNSLSLI